ncbi:restriction endonuclease subunit S [Pseudomonas coleopterorum]|uniref:restriction endonuclease subunit S n=1 Tax=Pseudomonas coleopterorum TaxID=1605838 RepID=UPI00178661B4|nr:restriction endonuclease subunit S [Pseudomonas coleopterorum]MBD8483638.1 restriction endonuclease subunit S [Pseudomonas coleopterorum]
MTSNDIPASWLILGFDEIFSQVSTSGKKVKSADVLTEGRFPVVDQGRSFVSGYLDDANLVVSENKPLIIFGDHTREIKWIDFPFIPGADGVQILKPHPEMDTRFLYYFLRNLPIESRGYARHFKIVKDAAYLVPPLAEQTRIAAKLDELLAKVDTLKARIDGIPALLKRFRHSVFAVAVSGHLTEKWRLSLNTSKPLASWKNCKIGDISSLVTSGSRGWADYYSDSGAIFIRSQDINTDELEISDTAFVKLPDSSEGKRTRVQYQDILLTITGANVGKVARVKQQIPEAYVSQHVALVRLYKPEYAPFIELFLKDIGSGRGILLDLAYGGGKPGLNLSNIRDLLLPLPPIDEQIEIIRRVEQLFAFADQLEAKVTKAQSRIDLLTQSILAKAFRGKLVPQDLNDEPASVLLERIKVKRAVPPKVKRRSKSS